MMLELLLISMYTAGAVLFLLFIYLISLFEQKEPKTSAYLLPLFWFPVIIIMFISVGLSILRDCIVGDEN